MARSQLPSPSAPMLLGDGTVVQPTTASTFARIEIPSNSNAQRLVSKTHRKLAEMPAMPKQLNSYAVVLVYTASGLSDPEISVATGFTIQQIMQLRSQPAYNVLQEHIVEAAREQAQDAVKGILVRAEVSAAERVVKLVDSKDDKIALAASRDLLDRGGHKPADRIDIRQQMMNTFRIEVVDKRGAAPVIDMEAE